MSVRSGNAPEVDHVPRKSELLSGGLRTMESMTAPYTTRSSVFFPNRL